MNIFGILIGLAGLAAGIWLLLFGFRRTKSAVG